MVGNLWPCYPFLACSLFPPPPPLLMTNHPLQTMLTDVSEQIYHPHTVTVLGGDSIWSLKQLNTVETTADEYVITLLRNSPEEYRWASNLFCQTPHPYNPILFL